MTRRTHSRRVLVVFWVLLTVAGCTGQDGGGQLGGEGGRLLAEAVISAAVGGTVTVATPDVLGGTAIAIPPGALVTDLTLRLRTGPMPDVAGVVGEALVIEPVDTSLAIPATVTLVYSEADVPAGSDVESLSILHIGTSGSQTLLSNVVVDTVTQAVQGDTSTLGVFVLIITPTPPLDTPMPPLDTPTPPLDTPMPPQNHAPQLTADAIRTIADTPGTTQILI